MRTITESQAEFLRELRIGLAKSIKDLRDRITSVRLECGHLHNDKNCPLCDIYSKSPENHFESPLTEFAQAIDAHLLRGPTP